MKYDLRQATRQYLVLLALLLCSLLLVTCLDNDDEHCNTRDYGEFNRLKTHTHSNSDSASRVE